MQGRKQQDLWSLLPANNFANASCWLNHLAINFANAPFWLNPLKSQDQFDAILKATG